MSSCIKNITGADTNCIKTTVSQTGQIKAEFIIRPYYPAGYVAGNTVQLNPSQQTTNVIDAFITSTPAFLDRNVLTCTKGGAAVMTGTTDTLVLYKSTDGTVVGDVRIEPAPVPSSPCDPAQPNLNGLTKGSEGLRVLTQGLPSYVTASDLQSQVTAVTYVDCVSNTLRAHVLISPEIVADQCAPDLRDGKVIKKNLLSASPTGLAVWGSKTQTVDLYQDCNSIVHADVQLKKDTAGCECAGCSQANARGFQALFEDVDGLFVWTGKNSEGGTNTFVDCTSKQLWTELIVAADPKVESCSTTPLTNAFRLSSDGWGVFVGETDCVRLVVDCSTKKIQGELKFPEVDVTKLGPSVLTAQNGSRCSSDGLVTMFGKTDCFHLYVDPVSRDVLGRIIIKPNPAGSVCDPVTATNALRCTPEGLAVEVGSTNCIKNTIDCPTGQIVSTLQIDPDSADVLSCGAAGLKFNDEAVKAKIDPDGCNGLEQRANGLWSHKGPPKGVAGYVHDGLNGFQVGDTTFSRRELTVSWTNPANSCTHAVVEIIYRAPTYHAIWPASSTAIDDTFDISWTGSFDSNTVGQTYGYGAITDGKETRVGGAGPTEHYFINLAPGQGFSAKMQPTANIASGAAKDISVHMGSYSLDLVVHWGASV